MLLSNEVLESILGAGVAEPLSSGTITSIKTGGGDDDARQSK